MEITRKALLPVRGIVGERDAVFPADIVPQFFVEPFRPAVEAVGPLVGGDTVFRAADGKPGTADTVGAPSDGAAQASVQCPVAVQVIVAQADIRQFFPPRSGTRMERTAAP